MLFRIKRDGDDHTFVPFSPRSAAEIGLQEKEIEDWIAQHPEILFGSEHVLVFAQSVKGQSMPDILALDGDGRVVVVEMKRGRSDRSTIGQLLLYAARIARSTFEELDVLARQYSKQPDVSLLEQFRQFADDPTITADRIGKPLRLYIVAPAPNIDLEEIALWLRSGGIQIDFVPFRLYSDMSQSEFILDIEPVPAPSVSAPPGDWPGDWFFNTNEANAPGAYERMFNEGVVAIYGYETGDQNLRGAQSGERIFAYVNRKGVLGVGKVLDGQVLPGSSVFSEDNEFHLRVEWATVVGASDGVTNQQVRYAFASGLPVRNAFCRFRRHDIANWIERELTARATAGTPRAVL